MHWIQQLTIRLKLCLVISIFFVSFTSAQSKEPPTITAEGIARIKVDPDDITVKISISKVDTIERNALAALNKDVSSLTEALKKLGISDQAIRISDQNISNDNGDEDRPTRYTASNHLRIHFTLNAKLLDAIFNEIQEKGFSNLDLSFDPTLSDSLEKATRSKLVQMAIADAQSNASNISKTLGLPSLKVKQISKERVGFTVFTNSANYLRVGATQFLYNAVETFSKYKLEPIELEERITIVYEVGK